MYALLCLLSPQAHFPPLQADFSVTLPGCDPNDTVVEGDPGRGFATNVDSSLFNSGILFFNANQGKRFSTEFNTQLSPYSAEGGAVLHARKMNKKNPYLEIVSESKRGNYGVRFSVFKSLSDSYRLPAALLEIINGIRFTAVGRGEDTLFVRVLDFRKNILVEKSFMLEKNTVKSFVLSFLSENAKEIVFFGRASGNNTDQAFGLDDLYLKTSSSSKFSPPENEAEFLSWLKKASYNSFDWNYVSFGGEKGVVVEHHETLEKISLSGLGYAYAIFVLAGQDGYIAPEIAKRRINTMLNWQIDQNWFDGSGGWHGFPHHYFKPDGSYYWADVSTIDWAICAAGLRVVKQFYAADKDIGQKIDTLLSRPDWKAAIDGKNKIVMGFEGLTGKMNPYRWGLAFSEETELVYLEAVASGKLSESIYSGITRVKKNGFYPSWFGAGFTYNWLQLWTGPRDPYKSNSVFAFKNDAETAARAFSSPLMGLTACETVQTFDVDGFFSWTKYISNQGGSIHGAGAGEVVQISPAVYGAALALPFTRTEAMHALRAYVKMGFYHEYLGLPDNVRIAGLPEGISPAPNFNSFDINVGPMILAIEQVQENRIGTLFLKDVSIENGFSKLAGTFQVLN